MMFNYATDANRLAAIQNTPTVKQRSCRSRGNQFRIIKTNTNHTIMC